MSGIRQAPDTSAGWINRRFTAIDRQLRELRAARSLAASSFPPGVIPASALAQFVAPGSVSLTATGFALTTAGATVVTGTVTVPNLTTACVVTLTGRVYAVNSTASNDYLLARTEVSAGSGMTSGSAVPGYASATGTPGSGVLNVSPLSVVLTGLNPGDTFDVRVWAKANTAAWSSNAANLADLAGTVTWFS